MGEMVEVADEKGIVWVNAGRQHVPDLNGSQIRTDHPAGFSEFNIRVGCDRLIQRLVTLTWFM